MKIITAHKRSTVFYIKSEDVFLKKFTPKLTTRLKFIFKLRKYPGQNFFYISNLLNSLNVKTPTIVNFSKYSVQTKRLDGDSLELILKLNPKNDILIQKYIELILIFLKNNIYCGDLSFDNFIVKDNNIYPFDLEDYRYVKFFKRSDDEFFRRLKSKIPNDIFELILKKYNSSF